MTRLASKQGHHPYRRGERRRKPFETGPPVPLTPGGALFPQGCPGTPIRGMVLLVEPEASLRWSLGNALLHCGYSVVEAATFAQAKTHLEQMTFDLLLLDLALPDETSWTLLRMLAESSALAPPVLILPKHQPGAEPEDAVPQETTRMQPSWLEDLLRLVERIWPAPGSPGSPGFEVERDVRAGR